MEGELNFPLPLSGVVSGFGYEINGNMVDGVIVEKEAARVAFEKEVRSGGKAALVEHVQGSCCNLYLDERSSSLCRQRLQDPRVSHSAQQAHLREGVQLRFTDALSYPWD